MNSWGGFKLLLNLTSYYGFARAWQAMVGNYVGG